MSNVQLAISQDFFMAFANVPRQQQKKINAFVTKFRADPTAKAINYEGIKQAANPAYKSVRIDQDYRGIVLAPEEGNIYLLLWVDKHDDAYRWAQNHRCEVNPETGSLQIYEAIHEERRDEAPEPEAATSPESKPLFDLRDREILRLGVPEERLDRVKAVQTVEELEDIQEKLPIEAFEALYFVADGVPLDEVMQEYAIPDGPKVDSTDIAAALDRPHSQRKFHVVEDELELQQMLEAPLEQWRVFLHPTQRKLVARSWNGPVRVLGGAGTGKTVVAIHRARWLAKNVLKGDERLLFTTFTRNLAMDIEENLRKICSKEQMKKIEVVNIDAWVHRFLKSNNESARIVYPGDPTFRSCWDKAMQHADSELSLPDSFYVEEWRRVVLPQRVQSREEYFKANRVGRGVALSRKNRAKLWPVFEEARFQLHQAGLMTMEDAVYAALDLLEAGESVSEYRGAIVDEAQDFGSETMRLLRAIVPEDKDDIFIVGDGHQRIYGRKASLGSCGINIRGRGRKLRINYRTTEQIRRFSTAVLEGVSVDDLDGESDGTAGYRSLIQGEVPVLKGFESEAEEADWVAGEIARLVEDGIRSQDICVVGRTKIQLKSIVAALDEKSIDHHVVSRHAADNSELPGVRTANMYRVKGLEFRVIFLVGICDGVLPFAVSMEGTEDPTELRLKEINERALLHVAGTRAIQALYVTWFGEPSKFIDGAGDVKH